MLASVMTASVVNGTISETDPTSVVLPTPKPPATTIFAEVVAFRPLGAGCGAPRELEPPKTTEHPFQEVHGRPTSDDHPTGVDDDQPHAGHVTDQYPNNTEWQPKMRRHLSNRPGVHAQLADRAVLRQQGFFHIPTSVAGGHQRLDRQVVVRPGPAAGPRVRADERTGLGDRIGRHLLRRHRRPLPGRTPPVVLYQSPTT